MNPIKIRSKELTNELKNFLDNNTAFDINEMFILRMRTLDKKLTIKQHDIV